jgi:hypothetical protein
MYSELVGTLTPERACQAPSLARHLINFTQQGQPSAIVQRNKKFIQLMPGASIALCCGC